MYQHKRVKSEGENGGKRKHKNRELDNFPWDINLKFIFNILKIPKYVC